MPQSPTNPLGTVNVSGLVDPKKKARVRSYPPTAQYAAPPPGAKKKSGLDFFYNTDPEFQKKLDREYDSNLSTFKSTLSHTFPVREWTTTVGPSVGGAVERNPQLYTNKSTGETDPFLYGSAKFFGGLIDQLKTPAGITMVLSYPLLAASTIAELFNLGVSADGIMQTIESVPAAKEAAERGDTDALVQHVWEGVNGVAQVGMLALPELMGKPTGLQKSVSSGPLAQGMKKLGGEDGFIQLSYKNAKGQVIAEQNIVGEQSSFVKTAKGQQGNYVPGTESVDVIVKSLPQAPGAELGNLSRSLRTNTKIDLLKPDKVGFFSEVEGPRKALPTTMFQQLYKSEAQPGTPSKIVGRTRTNRPTTQKLPDTPEQNTWNELRTDMGRAENVLGSEFPAAASEADTKSIQAVKSFEENKPSATSTYQSVRERYEQIKLRKQIENDPDLTPEEKVELLTSLGVPAPAASPVATAKPVKAPAAKTVAKAAAPKAETPKPVDAETAAMIAERDRLLAENEALRSVPSQEMPTPPVAAKDIATPTEPPKPGTPEHFKQTQAEAAAKKGRKKYRKVEYGKEQPVPETVDDIRAMLKIKEDDPNYQPVEIKGIGQLLAESDDPGVFYYIDEEGNPPQLFNLVDFLAERNYKTVGGYIRDHGIVLSAPSTTPVRKDRFVVGGGGGEVVRIGGKTFSSTSKPLTFADHVASLKEKAAAGDTAAQYELSMVEKNKFTAGPEERVIRDRVIPSKRADVIHKTGREALAKAKVPATQDRAVLAREAIDKLTKDIEAHESRLETADEPTKRMIRRAIKKLERKLEYQMKEYATLSEGTGVTRLPRGFQEAAIEAAKEERRAQLKAENKEIPLELQKPQVKATKAFNVYKSEREPTVVPVDTGSNVMDPQTGKPLPRLTQKQAQRKKVPYGSDRRMPSRAGAERSAEQLRKLAAKSDYDLKKLDPALTEGEWASIRMIREGMGAAPGNIETIHVPTRQRMIARNLAGEKVPLEEGGTPELATRTVKTKDGKEVQKPMIERKHKELRQIGDKAEFEALSSANVITAEDLERVGVALPPVRKHPPIRQTGGFQEETSKPIGGQKQRDISEMPERPSPPPSEAESLKDLRTRRTRRESIAAEIKDLEKRVKQVPEGSKAQRLLKDKLQEKQKELKSIKDIALVAPIPPPPGSTSYA